MPERGPSRGRRARGAGETAEQFDAALRETGGVRRLFPARRWRHRHRVLGGSMGGSASARGAIEEAWVGRVRKQKRERSQVLCLGAVMSCSFAD